MNFEEETARAITDLHNNRKQLMNRQLACEALLAAMLHRMDQRDLPGLLEEYEAAIDRIAAELSPQDQMEEHWLHFADAIRELLPKRPPSEQERHKPRGG